MGTTSPATSITAAPSGITAGGVKVVALVLLYDGTLLPVVVQGGALTVVPNASLAAA